MFPAGHWGRTEEPDAHNEHDDNDCVDHQVGRTYSHLGSALPEETQHPDGDGQSADYVEYCEDDCSRTDDRFGYGGRDPKSRRAPSTVTAEMALVSDIRGV